MTSGTKAGASGSSRPSRGRVQGGDVGRSCHPGKVAHAHAHRVLGDSPGQSGHGTTTLRLLYSHRYILISSVFTTTLLTTSLPPPSVLDL